MSCHIDIKNINYRIYNNIVIINKKNLIVTEHISKYNKTYFFDIYNIFIS